MLGLNNWGVILNGEANRENGVLKSEVDQKIDNSFNLLKVFLVD